MITDEEIISILETLNLNGEIYENEITVLFTINEYNNKANQFNFKVILWKSKIENKESFVNDLFYRAIIEGMYLKKDEIAKALGFFVKR